MYTSPVVLGFDPSVVQPQLRAFPASDGLQVPWPLQLGT
jgi:hypothetical protein